MNPSPGLVCACGHPAMPGRVACEPCVHALGPVDYRLRRPQPVATEPTPPAPKPEASEAWNWLAWVAAVISIVSAVFVRAYPWVLVVPLVLTGVTYWQYRRRLLDAVGPLWIAGGVTALGVIAVLAAIAGRLA